jgi:hypothetical protein
MTWKKMVPRSTERYKKKRKKKGQEIERKKKEGKIRRLETFLPSPCESAWWQKRNEIKKERMNEK